MRFDTNTEAMSREALEAKYFDAVQKLEAVGFGDDRFADEACVVFEIPPGQAAILDALMCGRLLSVDKILEITHGLRAGDVSRKTVDVQICRLRKTFKPFGIRIDTIHGAGYRIEPLDRQRIHDLIEQHRKDSQWD